MAMTAHEAIRSTRRARLWSVRRLAREAGLSPGYVSLIENGKRPLSARATGQIAEALGVPSRDLMAMAGFIPPEDLERAQGMAYTAMRVPELVMTAHGDTDKERLGWLTDDYLLLMGHDLSGKGNDFGPGGHLADWRKVDPDAPESRLLEELRGWKAGHASTPTPPTPIEGWDELSPADQTFIQQMVNKIRRPAAEE